VGVSELVTLTPDVLLLVEGDGRQMKGRFLEASDTVLRIRINTYPSDRDIPWTAIRRISRRAGRERRWWIPVTLAVVCGGLLASIGWLLDMSSYSMGSGDPYRAGPLTLKSLLIGSGVGALLGTVIACAFPGPWWEPIYAVPEGAVVATEEPVAARLTANAIPDETRQAANQTSQMVTLVAWTILALLFVGVMGFYKYAHG
jgi:hypothetical protein